MLLRLMTFCLLGSLLSTCGANVYERFASKNSDRYRLEEAKGLINTEQYAEALQVLQKLQKPSNEGALLTVSAMLGDSGLSLWDLVLKLVDNSSLDKTSGTGADRVLNALDSAFFGTGSVRTLRLAALSGGVTKLQAAPVQDSRIHNARCFLSAVAAFPAVDDGQQAASDVQKELQTLIAQVQGDGSTAAQCPNLAALNTSIASLQNSAKTLTTALAELADCPLFNSTADSTQFNQAQKIVQKFIAGADKGCKQVNCTLGSQLCQALQLGCVQKLLIDPTAKAGDGLVATCELVQNCATAGACF